jgi:glutamate N-acetyltransferase/amino-acid N-acetyltransferase
MPSLTLSPLAPTELAEMPPLAGVTLSVTNAAIKQTRRPDVLLMQFVEGTTVAGVLTQSQTAAAPIHWCRRYLANGTARALVVNSGNANAFTGAAGEETVQQVARGCAQRLDVPQEEIFMASTGVIGEPLDGNKIIGVLDNLRAQASGEGWHQAATAIMTTDTFAKAATRTLTLDGKAITIHGIAKGSGMIAPNMATMLGFVATDAAIAAPVLHAMLQKANAKSFNSITVDGDTSTNDACLLFATGQAGNAAIVDDASPEAAAFYAALESLLIELAHMIVRDGEGAQKFITVQVTGAASDEAAQHIALTIGNSPLVKTAIAGEDANWGRIVMAVGKAGETMDPGTLSIAVGGVQITKDGRRIPDYDEAPVAAHMKGQNIDISVDIGVGAGSWTIWTCDLTHGYISINADYRS